MTFRSLALLWIALVAGAAAIGPHAALAQVPETVAPSDTLWQVELADGSTLFGRVVSVTGTRWTLLSDAGVRVELERSQIRSMSPVRGRLRDGELWPEDSNTTRLFFGPTGRMMPAGQGYLAAYELFLPFVSYSLTDWFAIAGGTPIVPGALGEVFYLAPKLGLLQRENLAISAGVLAFFSTFEDLDSAGILYGVGTWGHPDESVTFGAGWPFASGDLAGRPAFLGGGEARLSRRTKLVSENYLLTFDDGASGTEVAGMLSGGLRFIGDRLSADLGLALAIEEGEGATCCLPLVNFVYHLGGGR